MRVNISIYADDLIPLASDEAKLHAMLEKLQAWCKKWRLPINIQKNKELHFRNKPK